MKTKLKMVLSFFAITLLISCSKDRAFKEYYSKSGIWEITELKVDYTNNSGNIDSSASYTNCGMFILYNSNIGAERNAYLGSLGVTTFKENHLGFAWYPEKDKMNLTLSTDTIPIRTYDVEGKGETQKWTYSGKNNSVLPGNSPFVNESLTVKRIKTN